MDHVASIENLEGHRFDSIEKKVKDGELIVTGEKSVTERTEGLGGSFTYCTLGPALELDKLLSGASLPSFDAVASLVFHMATNLPMPAEKKGKPTAGCAYLGDGGAFHVWLIYQPDMAFLKSGESALTLVRAKALVQAKGEGTRHLVFAPAKFVSQRMLGEAGLRVEFAPLPYGLYRLEKGQ